MNDLKPKNARSQKTRIGRGSTRGKTSGRGHKGQNAHGGHGKRPEERDMIKKLPKLRGHGKNRARTNNPSKERAATVTLSAITKHFADGEVVSPKSLLAKGLVARHNGRAPQVKVVATGELTTKVSVEGCAVSAGAKAAVEAKGGSVA